MEGWEGGARKVGLLISLASFKAFFSRGISRSVLVVLEDLAVWLLVL